MTRWLQRLAFLALLALSIQACVTPSVPIPPPSPEKVFFALDGDIGSATFRYDPDPSFARAIVYVFNRDVGQGIITTAEIDGSVSQTEPFPALEGDEIVITFETEYQLSSTCVTIRDGQSSSGFECEQ
ncbi:MAG: hypothetical protein GY811_27355 [Myxococcales bacterium]|nr:hypothetical protein [Myxococcales bacterium]